MERDAPIIAWVYEEREDLEDGSADALGVFSAHLQGGDEVIDGPERGEVDDALAWGRQRAEVVVAQIHEPPYFYSAGSRQPPWRPDAKDPRRPSAPLSEWPDGRKLSRRPVPELLYLRRTSADPVASWDVLTTVTGARAAGVVARELAEQLNVAEASAAATQNTVIHVALPLTASTPAEAEVLAAEACR